MASQGSHTHVEPHGTFSH